MTWKSESERHKLSSMGISTRHADRFSNVEASYKKAYGTPVYETKFWTIHVGEEVLLLTDNPKNWEKTETSLAVISPVSKLGGVRVAYYNYDGTLDVRNSFIVDVGFLVPYDVVRLKNTTSWVNSPTTPKYNEALRLHKYAKAYYTASTPFELDNVIITKRKHKAHFDKLNNDLIKEGEWLETKYLMNKAFD